MYRYTYFYYLCIYMTTNAQYAKIDYHEYNYNDDSDHKHDQEPSSYSLLPADEDRQAIITYLLFSAVRHIL